MISDAFSAVLQSGEGKPQRLHEHFVGLLADVFLRVGERCNRGLQPFGCSDADAVAVLGDFAELVHDFLQCLDVLFVGRRSHGAFRIERRSKFRPRISDEFELRLLLIGHECRERQHMADLGHFGKPVSDLDGIVERWRQHTDGIGIGLSGRG